MAKAYYRGSDIMLFTAPSESALTGATSSAKTIGYATNHTLTLNFENTDVSTKDGGLWGEGEVSKISWEITSESLYSINGNTDINTGATSSRTEGFDDIFQVATATGDTSNELWVAFAIQGTLKSPTHALGNKTYYYGKCIVSSLSANAAVGDNASFSVTLQGVGELKRKAGA